MILELAKHKGDYIQVVVTAPSNEGVNGFCEKFMLLFPQHDPLRALPQQTETNQMFAVATKTTKEQDAQADADATAYLMTDLISLQMLGRTDTTRMSKNSKATLRMQYISLVLLTLECLGIKQRNPDIFNRPDSTTTATADEHDTSARFKNLYWRSSELSPEESKEFEKLPVKECKQTLKDAVVIFTICSNAVSPWLRKALAPTHFFVDERAQGDEVITLAAAMMFFATLLFFVNIGDHMQLRAFGHTANIPDENSFYEQIRMSDSERKSALHVPTARLRTQHRATEGLMWFSSEHCYHGEIQDGEGTALNSTERPLSIRFQDFMENEYSLNNIQCFFDVQGTDSLTEEDGTSRYNPAFALAVGAFLMRLSKYFMNPNELKPWEICIICPYSRQFDEIENLLKSLMRLPQWRPLQLDKIQLSTMDSVQGREFDIVLLDTTLAVTGNQKINIGFLRELNRLNVAMSRAKSGVVVFGDQNVPKHGKKQYTKVLANLVQGFKARKCMRTLDGTQLSGPPSMQRGSLIVDLG